MYNFLEKKIIKMYGIMQNTYISRHRIKYQQHKNPLFENVKIAVLEGYRVG
jgi:hypothetical protein